MRISKRLAPMVLLVACGTQEGSEKGGPDSGVPACIENPEVSLTLTESSPLGFSGQDVLAWLSEGSTGALRWSDETTTTIEFSFAEGERGVHYAVARPLRDGRRCRGRLDRRRRSPPPRSRLPHLLKGAPMYTRRGLLTASLPLALCVPLGLTLSGRRAHAATGATKKLVVVFAQGGWDVTRVFAPQFADDGVAMEADAVEATVGGLRFVDHAERPSVRSFFERHHTRSAILNGLLVPSVAHDACTNLVMTGMNDDTASDWAARVAYAGTDTFALPGFVAAGPSFPGDAGSAVVRNGANGQLERLLRDGVAATLEQPAESLPTQAQDRIDAFVSARSSAALGRATGLGRTTRDAFDRSLRHAQDVKALSGLDFSADGLLSSQVTLGLTLLSQGVSRALTLRSSYDFAWDTHTNNDANQSPLWEELFADLLALADQLEALPGTFEASLLDETVVVVVSEMARTPGLNADEGKDHWPYTSALIFGGGVAGDRVLGGFDAQFYGDRVDPATGEAWSDGEELTTNMLGATLLALTGVEADGNEAAITPLASLHG